MIVRLCHLGAVSSCKPQFEGGSSEVFGLLWRVECLNLRVTLGLDKWQTLFLLLVGYRQNSAYRGTAFFFLLKSMKAKVSRDKIPLLFSFVIVVVIFVGIFNI